MNERNSIKAIDRTNLTEETKFRLDKICKIENYFHEEINQRKLCSKKLSKYVDAFDYTDNVLIVLSATSGGVSICLFTSIIGAPVGIVSASFTLIFSLTTRISKKLLSTPRKKKKKYDKILTLAKSKLNNIETLVSQELKSWKIWYNIKGTKISTRNERECKKWKWKTRNYEIK